VASSGEHGQATVEWIGLVLVSALAMASIGAAAGIGLPGAGLARAIGGRIVCALELSGTCDPLGASDLVLAYGDLAGLVSQTAPQIRYEPGMRALPVDFRDCREDACAEGRDGMRVASSLTGEPAAVFTHVVDCRPATETPGADCSGDAAGNVYVQYWLYYPGSATAEGSTVLRGAIRTISGELGHPTYHPDDWESVQFRIHPDGAADMRASAHFGYGAGWEPADDASYTVSGGSHAGTVEPADFDRITNPRRLGLIPLEPIADTDPDTHFAITPPWYKRAWLEPEYGGTD
jgi:hypothetical protein